MPNGVGEGEQTLVAVVVDDGDGALARLDVDDRAAQAVREYVRGQLSPRSRANALDALRRVARMATGRRDARAEDFPWPDLSDRVADLVRRGLHDLTVAEKIVPGTANLTLSHLRGMARTLYRMGLIDHERFTRIAGPGMLKNVPGKRSTRGKELTPDGESALRAAARALDGYQGVMLDTAIVLAIGGGLRREEVADVEVARVNRDLISIVGKGNKERKIPIEPQVWVAIESWLHERSRLIPSHDNLFCSPWRPDKVLSPWSFWAIVRRAAHAAFGDHQPCVTGCSCFEVLTGPHDFRRTFITRLLARGFDLSQVQELAGHESPETTARYDKRSKETLYTKRRNVRIIT